MAAVIPLILVGMLAWAASYRSFGPLLELEERAATVVSDQPYSAQALSRGLHLLSDGRPPSDPYVCRFTVVRRSIAVERRVVFTGLGNDSWLLTVEESKGSEPRCPSELPKR